MEKKLQKSSQRLAKRARELSKEGLKAADIAAKMNEEGFTTRNGQPIKPENVTQTYLKGRFKRPYTRSRKAVKETGSARSGGDEIELILLVLASRLDSERKLSAITAICEGRV